MVSSPKKIPKPPPAFRTIRIVCDDPDATDSSSDEECSHRRSTSSKQIKKKQMVVEIRMPSEVLGFPDTLLIGGCGRTDFQGGSSEKLYKPYTIVYFHSAASLQMQPDLGWMKRLQQILGRKHQRNLHAIYTLHPTLGLKAAILALQLLVNGDVWKKVVYVDRLLQLFKYVPREQLTIPDFVFQHDLEVNGAKGVIVDPRTKYVYQRTSA